MTITLMSEKNHHLFLLIQNHVLGGQCAKERPLDEYDGKLGAPKKHSDSSIYTMRHLPHWHKTNSVRAKTDIRRSSD